MENPMCWYLKKETMAPLESPNIKPFHQLVINSLKKRSDQIEPEIVKPDIKPATKISSFWDFLKKKK